MNTIGRFRRLPVAALICASCVGGIESDVLITTPPPAISSIAVSDVSEHGAVVTWVTSEPATGAIEFGLAGDQQTAIPLFKAETAHTATLAGLSAATLYHFRVTAKGSTGAVGSSDDQTFTTLGTIIEGHGDSGIPPKPDSGTTCTPSCGGKQCGDDGCGGTCGSCGAPQTCGGSGA